jgi:hypothetical protein
VKYQINTPTPPNMIMASIVNEIILRLQRFGLKVSVAPPAATSIESVF